MNKKIIVLNRATRKNGSTAKLVEAFVDGAESECAADDSRWRRLFAGGNMVSDL